MTERIPIRKAAMFEQLDEAEMIEGYHDGRAGSPEPGNNRSFSYWHGWRNGAVDGGHRQGDAAQSALAADYLATLKAQRKREGA
jgi:hypothetical protein